jgi:hypothetical protein
MLALHSIQHAPMRDEFKLVNAPAIDVVVLHTMHDLIA